jgi:hypothetical protein
MIEAVDQPKEAARIQFMVKNGMMFFNCTQETIDRAVENENRRKAYFRIDEWEDIP